MNPMFRDQIEQMSMAEKLGLIELLWEDISRNPEALELPERHRRILEERERALANGETNFIDFEQAMKNIRSRIESRRRANEDSHSS